MSAPASVIVHPLVLLSAVDHYTRIYGVPLSSSFDEKQKYNRGRKRAVGVLLGSYTTSKDSQVSINVASSYAGMMTFVHAMLVPFEEDERNPEVWYLDHNFHEAMYDLCRKVNDVVPESDSIPIKAYSSFADPSAFAHVSCTIGAEEAEEIGVAHLLRDVSSAKKPSTTEISTSVMAQERSISEDENTPPMLTLLSTIEAELVPLALKHDNFIQSLSTLVDNLRIIVRFLNDVSIEGAEIATFTMNPKINYLLQDIIHLLPSAEKDIADAVIQTSNDRAAMTYISTLVKTVVSLHNLIDNKLSNKVVSAIP